MTGGKCIKHFPKYFTNDTITYVDGYPIYHRRNTDNGFNLCNRIDSYVVYIWTSLYSEVTCYFTWLKWKNGCLESKEYQLMRAQFYSNLKLWAEYILIVCWLSKADWVFLSVTVIGYCHQPIVLSRYTQSRLLFAIELTSYFPTRTDTLWDKHKDSMSDDILHRIRTRWYNLTITFNYIQWNIDCYKESLHCHRQFTNQSFWFSFAKLNTKMNREMQ